MTQTFRDSTLGSLKSVKGRSSFSTIASLWEGGSTLTPTTLVPRFSNSSYFLA